MLAVYREIKEVLCRSNEISDGEASAISFMILEERYGLSRTDVLMRDEAEVDMAEAKLLAERIAGGEPVQYVLGSEWFCGIKFHVEQGVLIPRPETQELVEWVAESSPCRILDVGTGSGCIAISLARMLPHSSVSAVDVSEKALEIARGNSESLGVSVDFQLLDVLNDSLMGPYDCIVSNPPYICRSEAGEMERNVLGFEPHIALFVEDDDPLLFYRTIAEKAKAVLTEGGSLFFEINRLYGNETADMLASLGYRDIEVRKDQFGNDRMIKCKTE